MSADRQAADRVLYGQVIERRGTRVLDPVVKRWYKDGYAPFQLPGSITMFCGLCAQHTLVVTATGSHCPCVSDAVERQIALLMEQQP